MKTKLLTACVAAALLAGCGSDGKDPVKQVQAYDGAIWGIPGTYSCADGTSGPIPRTNYDGFANIPGAVDSQVISDPAQCSFYFGLNDEQKEDDEFIVLDTSNNKNMKNVSYTVPRGFATAGTKVTASPLTTFIALELGDEPYTPDRAKESLAKLGIDTVTLENEAQITLEQLLSDTSTAMEILKANTTVAVTYSKIVATTHVLSDALVAKNATDKVVTTSALADSVKATSENVVKSYPTYPINIVDGEEKIALVDLAQVIKETIDASEGEELAPITEDAVKENTKEGKVPTKPANPNQPPTGTGIGGQDPGNNNNNG